MLVPTFIRDRLVRDKKGLPLGRVVLVDNDSYEVGVDRLDLVLIECPKARVVNPLKADFYIDGILYRIQPDVPDLRISRLKDKVYINNVFLEKKE